MATRRAAPLSLPVGHPPVRVFVLYFPPCRSYPGFGMARERLFYRIFTHRYPEICVWIYVGNNNAPSTIAIGDSTYDYIVVLVSRIWHTLRSINISSMFTHPMPKLNPSDLPARGRSLPYPIARRGRIFNLRDQCISPMVALRVSPPPDNLFSRVPHFAFWLNRPSFA